MSNVEDEFTQKSRIGIYDPGILCMDCEKKFQIFDEYGQKILLQKKDLFQPIFPNDDGKNLAWIFPEEVDFGILNKFFISILYRADLSEKVFFQHVSLDSYRDVLRNIIEGISEIDDRIAIFIRKFDVTTNRMAEQILLDPRPIHLGNGNIKFYQIYLGTGYVIYIKIDKREIPSEFKQLVIGNFPKLYLISGDLNQSAELDILKKIAKSLKEKADSGTSSK